MARKRPLGWLTAGRANGINRAKPFSPQDQPRETHVLTRGDFLKPAKVVEPGVPAYLNPLPTDVGPARLAFAKWMVDPKAPTTARSLVNRFWQMYFGTGIVSTSEDL